MVWRWSYKNILVKPEFVIVCTCKLFMEHIIFWGKHLLQVLVKFKLLNITLQLHIAAMFVIANSRRTFHAEFIEKCMI
jgi:hypothetical protein